METLSATSVSIPVALLIGSIEVIGLVGDQFELEGGLWRFGRVLDENLDVLGFAIVGVFITAWAVSVMVYRLGRGSANRRAST